MTDDCRYLLETMDYDKELYDGISFLVCLYINFYFTRLVGSKIDIDM